LLEFLSASQLLLLSPGFHCWSLMPCFTYFLVNLPAGMPWCKSKTRKDYSQWDKIVQVGKSNSIW
jgi:hypothetical protein